MARMKDLRERIDPRIVAWIGARASEALAYAHALTDEAGNRVSLVHRDVSPQNLFLTYDGHVKVIDFGIAHAEGRLTHTGLGRIKGKFSYMAPEQMLKQGVDHRADLFSLGATLYEAALGARPFEAEDEAEAIAMLLEETAPKPQERIPGFPESLSKILLHALEREPADRYGDGTRMARDLDDFVRATGSAEMAPELARLMTRCFAAEREAQARAVASLRGMEARRLREPVGSTTTADPIASSIRPSPRRPDRRWLIFGATGLCAVIIGSVAAFARHGPASSDAAPSSTVAVAKAIAPTPASAEVASVGSGDAPLVAPAPPSAFAPSPESPTVRTPQSPSKALSPKATPRDAKSLPPKPPAKKHGDSLVTDYPF
jgi:serine/threonine-protein kinase